MQLQRRSSFIVASLLISVFYISRISALRLKRQLCDPDSNSTSTGCRPNDDNSTLVCSGRGSCICGACECDKLDDPFMVISGDHCECDNFSCVRRNGLMCSGALHGECVCGQCVCRQGYMSNRWGDCACRLDTSTCVAPDGSFYDELCSGHGECFCGQCQCEPEFSGRYCEICPTCPGECEGLKECVECEAFGGGLLHKAGGALAARRCGNCSTEPTIVEGQLNGNDTMMNGRLCQFYDEKDCLLKFTYYYDNHGNLNVRAQKERQCPEKSWFHKVVDWFGN